MLALIALSVLFARYRKRNKVVVDLTKQAKDAKEEASKKVRALEKEKAALQDKLRAAQKLVKQVMAEGGRLLDTYHLNYSDINFGEGGIEGRHKLGEGS